MKAYGGVMYRSMYYFLSALAGPVSSASRPGEFIPGGKCHQYQLDKRPARLGPSAVVDEKKMLRPYWNWNSNPSAVKYMTAVYAWNLVMLMQIVDGDTSVL
jgi:hypothetical protein